MKQLNIQQISIFFKKYFKQKKIYLHEPNFTKGDFALVNRCIKSTFVSAKRGEFVKEIENKIRKITKSNHVVAVNSGTSALHISLILSGANEKTEIITQPLTFVATCNAIAYCNSKPIFVDVSKETLGMCPKSLNNFLKNYTYIKNKTCFNKKTKKKIAACLPVHLFGNPAEIDEITKICKRNFIKVIEDSTECLGSYYKKKHLGTYGDLGTLSFNGNKIITTGMGGAIITNNKSLAKKAYHIAYTSKKNHKYEFIHDQVGYNYGLPNLNAALGINQISSLSKILNAKKKFSKKFKKVCDENNINFFQEINYAKRNNWLNICVLKKTDSINNIIKKFYDNGVYVRPVWKPMTKLNMFKKCQKFEQKNSKYLENKILCFPSPVK